jgi:protein arginine N-methyltransferase 1
MSPPDAMDASNETSGVKSKDLVVTKPADIDDADFANYFCTYGYLYHQKDMLEDQNRMTAYHDAVRLNPDCFKDKVVLDVGTGSGVLAMWAAQAGAKKVYAVEATHMAAQARKIVAANGLSDVVEVIQCKVEELELPEKVDVIISEWMGYFLLRESMFDSVLGARDKWMKPGGAMFPSHAKMYLSAIKTQKGGQKHQELQESLHVWDDFVANTHENYGIDLSCMNGEYEDEQKDHYLNTSAWVDIKPQQKVSNVFTLASFDLNKCTMADISVLRELDFKLTLYPGGGPPGSEARAGAFAGWFDVTFAGSEENPCENIVELTTAPDANGATHWGQQAFYMYPEISASDGAVISGKFDMLRRKENQRLYSVRISWTQSNKDGVVNDSVPGSDDGRRTNVWHIE